MSIAYAGIAVFIVFALVTTSYADTSCPRDRLICGQGDYQCPMDRWTCASGKVKCIWEEFICDGKKNCEDGSDEDPKFCETFQCLHPLRFTCDNASPRCIYKDAICDGNKDCSDGFDETRQLCKSSLCSGERWTCPLGPYDCPRERFACGNGTVKCIWQEFICDGKNDCTDGSDENPAMCARFHCDHPLRHTCDSGMPKCIYKTAVCDKKNDCSDGSDERNCNGPTTTTEMATPANSCEIPPAVVGRGCLVNCTNKMGKCSSVPGAFAPPGSELVCACESSYALMAASRAFCINGNWFQSVPTCIKLCKALKSNTLDFLQCSHAGVRANCSKRVRPGTTVRVKCKSNYVAENPALEIRSLTCTSDGTWDAPLFQCKPNCGIGYTKNLTPLLSVGSKARKHEVPWHVPLYLNENGKQEFVCGGTIITSYLIITAAHCVYNEDLRKFYNASEYTVAVGKISVKFGIVPSVDSGEAKFYKIDRIYTKNFRGLETFFADDIALLETKENIQFTSNIMPACVHWTQSADTPPPSLIGKIAGWGITGNGTDPSSVLLTADMPYLTEMQCRQFVSSIFIQYILQNDKFCAGGSNGVNTEKGDSGGGLTFKGDNNLYFIYGLVSHKESGSTVSSFTKVYSHIAWIEQIRKQVHSRKN